MSDAFLGEIRLYGFNFAPRNWALANGALLPISQNTALFSILGTNFGGNGVNTFGLPNINANVVVGAGAAASGTVYDVGETGGQPTVTLTTASMPAHTHSFNGDSFRNAATTNTPSSTAVYADASGPCQPFLVATANPPTVPMAPTALSPSGSSAPHQNQMPTLVLNFCICTMGIYPQRP